LSKSHNLLTITLVSYKIRLMTKVPSTFWSHIFPLTILGYGIILRLANYLANRSLWLDEAFLALNIINRNYSGLLRPLDYHQVAPTGFLLLTKFFTSMFGSNEFALRFLPFFLGIIALFSFYLLSRELFMGEWLILSVAFFSFSDSIIYYTAELKPYSGDVFFTIALCGTGLKFLKERRQGIIFTILAILAPFFSFPSVFIVCGLALTFFYQSFKKRKQGKYLSFLPILLGIVSILFNYLLQYLPNLSDIGLRSFWDPYFFHPASLPHLLLRTGKFIRSPFYLAFGISIAFLIILGVVSFGRRVENFIFISSFLFFLLASFLRFYPIHWRLILFSLPILIIYLVTGIAQLCGPISKNRFYLIRSALGLLGLFVFLRASFYLFNPRTVEEIRPLVHYLQKEIKDGDKVYVYYGAVPPFLYYNRTRRFAPSVFIIYGKENRERPEEYIKEMNQLSGRVWFLFSHFYGKEKEIFLDYLKTRGKLLDSQPAPGALLYLYDL